MANILWANQAKREHSYRNGEGKLITEKLPQAGSVDAANGGQVQRKALDRCRRVIDAAGHEVTVPITTAASEFDTDGPYARKLAQKWAQLGWFESHRCARALAISGDLRLSTVASKECRTGDPCDPRAVGRGKPSCVHTIAERDARRAEHAERENRRAIANKSEASKIMEAQLGQNESLIRGFTDAIATAIAPKKGRTDAGG